MTCHHQQLRAREPGPAAEPGSVRGRSGDDALFSTYEKDIRIETRPTYFFIENCRTRVQERLCFAREDEEMHRPL